MYKRVFTFCILFAFLAVVTLSGCVSEETDPKKAAKEADIKRLLDLTGSAKLGMQVMEQLIASFKRSMTQVPAKFWDEFLAEVDANELVKLTIPIYDKYLSHSDIKALITFFETPAGKRFIKAQPMILQESMAAGQKWGAKIAQKVMQKLEEKGYK